MTAKAGLKSMTGYAQGRAEQNGWIVRVRVRSVNHRFLDLHLHLPEGFDVFEPQLRQAVRDRIRRGHLDLVLHFESSSPAAIHVNQDVAAAYLKAVEQLRKQFGLAAEPDLAAILRLPGVLGTPALAVEEEQQRLGALVQQCLDQALGRLEEMRESEARQLASQMVLGLEHIARNTDKIEALAERIQPAFARRLDTRLKELLGGVALDPARIAQVAALLAELSDSAVELARLRSHVQQFQALLAAAGEVGKKLDFLLQEMHREANTLLSKTPGLEADGLAITGMALEVKSEIEKLREQVQNIE
jgi:uncharacterized protein (TIGR00255 family)